MRACIDAARQSGDDGEACLTELSREPLREAQPEG